MSKPFKEEHPLGKLVYCSVRTPNKAKCHVLVGVADGWATSFYDVKVKPRSTSVSRLHARLDGLLEKIGVFFCYSVFIFPITAI